MLLRPICPPWLTGFPWTHFNYLILQIIRSGERDLCLRKQPKNSFFPLICLRHSVDENMQRRIVTIGKITIVPFSLIRIILVTFNTHVQYKIIYAMAFMALFNGIFRILHLQRGILFIVCYKHLARLSF